MLDSIWHSIWYKQLFTLSLESMWHVSLSLQKQTLSCCGLPLLDGGCAKYHLRLCIQVLLISSKVRKY